MRRLAFACLLFAWAASDAFGQDAGSGWEQKFFNPKPLTDDLILPTPCGGAMVFRPVEVVARNWIDDAPVVIGGDVEGVGGVLERARRGYLSGSFSGQSSSPVRLYWISKYEITILQWKAVFDDCIEPSIGNRVPVNKVGWFDGTDFIFRYNSWLFQNAIDLLPSEDGVVGFVRFPTEVEWEYAARGGLKVSAAEFQARTFDMDGKMYNYVWFQGTTSADGRLRPVGLKKPNALGIHDILGNVEEIVLDPFRLNKFTRLHGQPGGFTTKGGHYLTPESQIRTSYRQEYHHFNTRTRMPSRVDTIGFRLAIGGLVLPTRERLNKIAKQWAELPSGRISPSDDRLGPVGNLRKLKERFTDPELREQLQILERELENLLSTRNEHRDRAIITAIRLGSSLGQRVWDDHRRIESINGVIPKYESDSVQLPGILRKQREIESRLLDNLSYYFDTVKKITEDYSKQEIDSQLELLYSEVEAQNWGDISSLVVTMVEHMDAYRIRGQADLDEWRRDLTNREGNEARD